LDIPALPRLFSGVRSSTDRALGFEPRGCRFDSYRTHEKRRDAHGSLAQLVEQLPLKETVAGSIPARPTIGILKSPIGAIFVILGLIYMERQRLPAQEELDRPMPGIPETLDDFSPEELRHDADRMLDNLGLTLEDLRDKRVMDLGSGRGIISRVAKEAGIADVISVDDRKDRLSRHSTMPRVAGTAPELPFADKSIDLILCHATVPGMTSNTKEVLKIIEELERIVTDKGEIRIWPPRLISLNRNNQLYRDLYAAFPENLKNWSQAEEDKAIMTVSTSWLQQRGYNITLVEKPKDPDQDERPLKNAYWVLRKRIDSLQETKD
jgi:SAM-dependent methyltransferase